MSTTSNGVTATGASPGASVRSNGFASTTRRHSSKRRRRIVAARATAVILRIGHTTSFIPGWVSERMAEPAPDVLAIHALGRGSKLAVVDDRPGGPTRRVTFAELNTDVNQLANALLDAGLTPDD